MRGMSSTHQEASRDGGRGNKGGGSLAMAGLDGEEPGSADNFAAASGGGLNSRRKAQDRRSA